jgi:2-iminobutanoate/2-iminopropanoate deaminase
VEAAGSSLEHIVNTHVYLSDIADFAAMNEVYRTMIPAPYPTRTTVAAQLRGILVEIEVIAVLAQGL